MDEFDRFRSLSPDVLNIYAFFLLRELRDEGCQRLALYGSRAHNEKIYESLVFFGFKDFVVVENDNSIDQFLGRPVITPDEIEGWNPDVILVSSDTFEREIWAKCERFRKVGIECRRFYEELSMMRRAGELLFGLIGSEKNSDSYWEKRLSREVGLGTDCANEGSERSVLFIHHNYYHFYYLAGALRRRGWWAFSVSVEDPNGPFSPYYHGEDLNLFSEDKIEMCLELYLFFEYVRRSFRMVHFSGHWRMAFFPDEFGREKSTGNSFDELRQVGLKIGYTINGCTSGVAQSTVRSWSLGGKALPICDVCAWQHVPSVCSDEMNLAWGREMDEGCSLIAAEASPALGYLDSSKTVFEPLTMCAPVGHLDMLVEPPEQSVQAREDGELLIFHAVGNYDIRNVEGRNAKGTPYVLNAIERLKEEGYLIRLMFLTDVPSMEIGHYQRQADIVVDQLHYGRYGATAREAMMLGKPLVGYYTKHEVNPKREIPFYDEVPIVSAHEGTIVNVLRKLIVDGEYRRVCGIRSREFALKWHAPDACAERYEWAYDRVMAGEDLS